MKRIQIFKAVSLVFTVMTVIIVALKISPFECCSCPPSGYRLDFITRAVYLNKHVAPLINCSCILLGCAKATYVIPIETIFLAFLFGFLGFKKGKVNK